MIAQGLQILVIDDDDGFRGMVRAGLEEAGYRVLEARDGDAGLALIASVAPDAVITDIVMPGREGIETILELRRSQARLPVIAVSGGGAYGGTTYLELARRLGAAQVLQKPFALDALLEALEAVLSSR